jgi:hypothetical protein
LNNHENYQTNIPNVNECEYKSEEKFMKWRNMRESFIHFWGNLNKSMLFFFYIEVCVLSKYSDLVTSSKTGVENHHHQFNMESVSFPIWSHPLFIDFLFMLLSLLFPKTSFFLALLLKKVRANQWMNKRGEMKNLFEEYILQLTDKRYIEYLQCTKRTWKWTFLSTSCSKWLAHYVENWFEDKVRHAWLKMRCHW